MALSSITRIADGIQNRFTFNFGYLTRSHVFMFVDNVLVSYKWVGEFELEALVTPLPDQVVTIRRLTDRANRITNFTDGQTLLAESLNVGDLQVFYIAQEMIDQIEEGIVAGDVSIINPGSGYITAQWIQDQLTANLAAASQFEEIDAALLGEAAARAAGLAAEAAARAAAIGAEATARAAAVAAEAAARTADVLALTEADADQVGRLVIVESDLNDPTTGVKAKLVTVEDAVATETSARASADTAILAEINDPTTGLKARATSLESRTTNVELNKAEASALSALTARVTTAEGDITAAEAAITAEASARATADSAFATDISGLLVRVGDAEGAIVDVQDAIATETAARVSAVNALDARVGPVEAGLVTVNTAVADLNANKASASSVTALTSEVDTVKLSRGGTGPLPDPNKYDSVFWALQAGKTAFAEGNPFPSGVRSILIADSVGLLDTMTQSFKVEPGATYQITFAYWNGSGTFSGYVRPLIRVPGVEWRNPVNNAGVNDTGPAGQAGDLTAGGVANSHTISLTVPGTVGYLQFRTRSSFTGANFYYRWIIEKLSAAEDSVARASITNEATTRAAADSAAATVVNTLQTSFAGRQALNGNPFFDEGPAATGVPPRWANWSNGESTIVEAKPWGAVGLHAVMPVLTGTPQIGIVQNLEQGSIKGNSKYLMRAEVARGTGSLVASGVLLHFYNASYERVADYRIAFATEADTSGLIATTGDGRRVWEKEVVAPATATMVILYAMSAYEGFGTLQASSPLLRWFECSLSLVSRAQAGVTELRKALTTGNSSLARLLLAVNTGTNIATIEAAAFAGDGVWNGSAITLQADLIKLLARNINFGTRTTFEDTRGTIYNIEASKRLRLLGPFGASNDLVLWYGNDSVGLQSETKTNGIFAIATDGLLYLGTSILSAPPPRPTANNAVYNGLTGTNRTTAAASLNLNGLPTPTSYSWSCGDSTVQVLTPNSATSAFRVASLGGDLQAPISCTIETSQGTFICPGVARWTVTN